MGISPYHVQASIKRAEAMTKRKIEAHEGSGNIFADLELPDADGLLLKSSIVIELHRLIKERGLTQVKAAKLLGITQPDLSHLLRGDFEDYSAERLMKMLTVFEQDIEIVMKPHRQSGERGRITFKPAAAYRAAAAHHACLSLRARRRSALTWVCQPAPSDRYDSSTSASSRIVTTPLAFSPSGGRPRRMILPPSLISARATISSVHSGASSGSTHGLRSVEVLDELFDFAGMAIPH
jgi:predicted XRE-type DNA-binding protein